MNGAVLALAATTGIQIAAAMAALTLPAVAPLVAHDLGVPTSMVGTYIALLYVAASASALVGGGLVLRVGAIRMSQIGLALCASALLLGIAPAIALVTLGALVLGLGYGPITPASSHVLAKTASPGRMALTLSVKQTGVPAGFALAGIVVPPLAVAFGWHAAVASVAALCLLVALLVQPLRGALDADRDRGARISVAQVLAGLRLVAATPRLRVAAAVSFVYSGMQMCVSSFIVAYLVEEIELTLVTAGLGLTVASLSGVVARIAWGGVADRWLSPRATLAVLGGLMAVAAACVAMFSSAWPLALMWFVLAVLGASAIGWNGVYLAEVARVAPPGRAGLATGGCLFFTYFGVVFGPLLFGLLQRVTTSYVPSFLVATGVCAAVALLLARAPREEP